MWLFLLVLLILTPRRKPSCEFHVTSGDAKSLLMVALTGQPFTRLQGLLEVFEHFLKLRRRPKDSLVIVLALPMAITFVLLMACCN